MLDRKWGQEVSTGFSTIPRARRAGPGGGVAKTQKPEPSSVTEGP